MQLYNKNNGIKGIKHQTYITVMMKLNPATISISLKRKDSQVDFHTAEIRVSLRTDHMIKTHPTLYLDLILAS